MRIDAHLHFAKGRRSRVGRRQIGNPDIVARSGTRTGADDEPVPVDAHGCREERGLVELGAEHADIFGGVATHAVQPHPAMELFFTRRHFRGREPPHVVVPFAARPLAQRVADAFQAKPMKPGERTAISALLHHPGSTSAELSAAAGWRGNTWHLRFGTMCKDRVDALWPAPGSEVRDAEFFTGILADFDKAEARFTLKPEVAEAFQAMGL